MVSKEVLFKGQRQRGDENKAGLAADEREKTESIKTNLVLVDDQGIVLLV